MGPCEHNADRWLDHLYGLLSDQESRELLDHVALCPSCQAGLAEAQRDQRRMARASRRIRNVPEFQLPQEEPVSIPAELNESPATLPMTKPKPRRSRVRRLLPVWAAAAALLLAAVGGAELYSRGMRDHDRGVADAKKQIQELEGQFVTLKREATEEQQKLLAQARADTLRLFAVGATRAHPDAPYACRIATRDFDGHPVSAQLEVRLVAADSGALLHREPVASTGEVEVLIPAGLKLEKSVRLEITAKHGAVQAELSEPLQVAPASHLVHLATNKAVAQLGEVVFFRALALERYSLKPPATPLPLRFALVNAKGKSLAEVSVTTGPGGIASGEFALVNALAPGIYTIQVAAADPKQQVQAQTRALEVVERLSDFDIRIEPKVYRAGDKVVMEIKARGPDGQPLPEKLVVASVGIAREGMEAKLTPSTRAKTNAEGRVTLDFKIPKNISSSRIPIQFELQGVKKGANGSPKVMRMISVVPSHLKVDFYPEGGDLVAGLAQRVFFRVRTPSGETAAPDAPVTLHSKKSLIFQSDKSLGSFTFTPDPRENYTLRVPAGGDVGVTNDPFEKLGIQKDGVVLSVANSVGREGDAVRMELRRTGLTRPLLVVATCRGQIVGQHSLGDKATQAEINLPNGIHGIVRLTVYEIRDQQLTPRAERLVYRSPAQRLDLKTTTGNFQPGQATQLKINARDERGQPATGWALAVVVDDQYRGERHERSLAGHFLVASEFGADLADAPLLADDAAATQAALDLFLGTHGWRRFVAQAAEPEPFAQAKTTPVLFSAENLNPEQARAQATALAQRGLTALQQRIDREQSQLSEQRERLAANLTAVLQARNAFDRLPWETFRLAIGILTALSFLAGGICLAYGLARALRRKASTPAFASAFAALGLCFVLFLSGGSVTPIVNAEPGEGEFAGKPFPPIAVALAKDLPAAPAAPLVGQVALAAPASGLARDPNSPRSPADLTGAFVMNDSVETPKESARANFVQHPQLQQRFGAAAKMQQTPGQLAAEFGREFAHRNQPGFDAQPTLLWHPSLRIDNGSASVGFDVAKTPATYRILVYGHDGGGRLGFHETRVGNPAAGK